MFPNARGHNLLGSAQLEAWLNRQQEDAMAKGKDKGNKEVKKPKADKNAPKGAGSSYQQSKGGKK